jgi:hypothetical protein
MQSGRPPRSLGPLATGALVVVGVVVVAGAAFAACVATLDFGPVSQPVKPIPIPTVSCPYLRAVHTTAESAGDGWGDVFATSDRRSWRPFAAQLGPKLATLELALRVAIPHVPSRVATDLRRTLAQVRLGRAKLGASRTFWGYLDNTNYAALSGYENLSHASELVGHACGFTHGLAFAPDIGRALDATTTTPRASR